ncbi:MAG: DUF6527 family protein [Gemmatimonadaceae bacterium]
MLLWTAPVLGHRRHGSLPRRHMASRMNLLRWFQRLWQRAFTRRTEFSVRYVSSMNRIPNRLGQHIYVVGDGDNAKWAVLACPCPLHERIDINLMRSRRPSWQLQVTQGVVTLSPSLRMPDTECGSHFWIKKSRVVWVEHDQIRRGAETRASSGSPPRQHFGQSPGRHGQ